MSGLNKVIKLWRYICLTLISKWNHNLQEIIIFGIIFSRESVSQILRCKGSNAETDHYGQNKHLFSEIFNANCCTIRVGAYPSQESKFEPSNPIFKIILFLSLNSVKLPRSLGGHFSGSCFRKIVMWVDVFDGRCIWSRLLLHLEQWYLLCEKPASSPSATRTLVAEKIFN